MNQRLTITFFLLAISFCMLGCTNGEPDCEGNCYTGYGVKKWADGGYTRGHWKNGQVVGSAKQFFGSTSVFAGDTYVGEFGEGGYNGYGTYYSKKADGTQVGFWKRGKPDGYSKLTFNVHSSKPILFYEGNWKEGKYDGFGKLNYDKQGDSLKYKYAGNFVNGLFEGEGDLYNSDATHYHGHFANGYKNGEGIFYFADGSKYEGVWVDDESEGFDEFKKKRGR